MMAAVAHMGLGEWRLLVDDLDAMGLIKPATDRQDLANALKVEFYEVLGPPAPAKKGPNTDAKSDAQTSASPAQQGSGGGS